MAQRPKATLSFASLEEEVRFLRGLVSVQRLADEVLEDCLERQLGLEAAIDVFLGQCARLLHAQGAFVELRGKTGPALTRSWGRPPDDWGRWASRDGVYPLSDGRTLFVAGLTLGRIELGTLGFVLMGAFEPAGGLVRPLVDAVAEMLDSAVLSFLALAEGQTPLERLDELGAAFEFRPRARIGRYELLCPLGTGGMAQVLVARSVNPGGVSRLVALKRILPRLLDDPSIVRQFEDEARLGMKLAHPNLVTLHDYGFAGGMPYIVMELVKGVDLESLLVNPQDSLSPPLISAVMCQALVGLHAAHELRSDEGQPLGLVHRDLSPHNLMLGFDGRVKVLDFGVAKARGNRTDTLPGIAKGKPLYMSPEQAVAEPVDRRSDLFAMGLILYEAFEGRRAFERGDDTRSMEAIVRDPLPRPSSTPLPFWRVIERALEKHPAGRYQDALEMAEALRGIGLPMSEAELGRVVTARFPRRVAEIQAWEAMKHRLALTGEWPSRGPA